jgi:hypothetical protein
MSIALDVIVRTQADASRSDLLFRALDSIQSQQGVEARPIVVVNGQNFDSATMASLQSRAGIVLHHEQRASAGLALVVGRQLVEAPFFSYLDDDDELIPGSLAEPMRWFHEHQECDVLVNNGYYKRLGKLVKSSQLADQNGDPALALSNECWLSPGAFLCRTASVPASMLSVERGQLEWTYLAFELCAEHKRVDFMDVPTVRYLELPGSLSKQPQHREAALELLRGIYHDTRHSPKVRHSAYRKYLRTLHNLALEYWNRGQHGKAWRCHLNSLLPPYTLRYLLFSRKLLWPSAGKNGYR